jgi:nucleoside-diphosphate-sugar epimerase
MKVFVAGATGALGSKLVPRLVAGGHDVVGMTRSERKAGMIQQMGATPAIADGLDAEAVGRAVGEAEPEVIVHELTALSGSLDLRKFEQSFALTNRLRTEGTDHLLAAARAVGAKRFIAQSYAAWTYERTGGPIKTEDDPLDPDPVPATRTTLDAIRYLEAAVTGAEWVEGLVLRYGGFYGPGTSMSLNPEGEHVEMIRKRKFPLVGESSGIWSLIQIDDAAAATAAAVEGGAPGIYNVVDDQPAAAADWLPGLAEAVGAKRPMRVPRWLGRIMAGEAAVTMMTETRGASNAKAKSELGWAPKYPTWRDGFAHGLA